jgi:hypothetical protein
LIAFFEHKALDFLQLQKRTTLKLQPSFREYGAQHVLYTKVSVNLTPLFDAEKRYIGQIGNNNILDKITAGSQVSAVLQFNGIIQLTEQRYHYQWGLVQLQILKPPPRIDFSKCLFAMEETE